jgi:hypothetical protein
LLLKAQELIHLPSCIAVKKKNVKINMPQLFTTAFITLHRPQSNSAAATTAQLLYAITSHAQPSGQV